MRRFFALLLLASLLTACGGDTPPATESGLSTDDIINTRVAATSKALNPTKGDVPPTRTPDNAVQTAEAGGLNTDFATAQKLSGDPIKATVKESTLYYKVDVPRGGVISTTLAVEAGSPEPVSLSLYDQNQSYVDSITIPVGERGSMSRVFGDDQGGTVFLSVQGNSSYLLAARGGSQDDGGSGKDAPDDQQKAIAVKAGTISGILGNTDTKDSYSFEMPTTGQNVKLTIKASEQSHTLTLFDEDKGYLVEVDNTASEDGVITRMVEAEKGGRWYFDVRGEGSYSVTLEQSSQDDAGSGKDAGNDYPKALVVKIGEGSTAVSGTTIIEGRMGDSDGDDYYGFDLPKTGGTISATLTTTDGDINISLYDDVKNYIVEASTAANAADPALISQVLNVEDGGRWYFRVRGEGGYKLTLGWANQDDAGTGKDAGDDFDKSIAITTAEFNGTVGDRDQDDYFKIKGDAGGTLTITLTGGSGSINVSVYDQDQNYIGEETVSSTGESIELKPEFREPGKDYYLRVRGESASYTIAISQ